jgi:hypothetical protein
MSTTESFTGRTSLMRTSPWLAVEDIDGLGDVQVTIEEVFKHRDAVMQDGRKMPVVYSLKFAGKEKQMVLNATNRKALAAAFTTDTKVWRGKTVTLYVKDGVRNPAGGTTKGIRIR